MKRYQTFAVICLLSLALTSCGRSSQNQISRAGEVQFQGKPEPVVVMLVHPKSGDANTINGARQRAQFYASKVNGLYIMQGDMIIDSDAARKQYNAAVVTASTTGDSDAAMQYGTKGATLKDELEKSFGEAKTKALLSSKFYIPSGVRQEVQGAYIPANAPYAIAPPSADLPKGAYLPLLNARWSQPIQYCISPALDQDTQSAVASAIQLWHDDTSLAFTRNPPAACQTFHTSMMFFVPGNGCASYVGRLSSQVNPIYLADNCADVGGVAHEIGHALGLFHEQDRPDRDQYITVNTANILPGFESQFNHDSRLPLSLYGHYDCGSLMQYPTWAFQKQADLKTIDPKPGCNISDMLTGPDQEDISEVKMMYNLGVGAGGGQ